MYHRYYGLAFHLLPSCNGGFLLGYDVGYLPVGPPGPLTVFPRIMQGGPQSMDPHGNQL